MKALIESLLDDEEDMVDSQSGIESLIKTWINKSCVVIGDYTIDNGVINVDGSIYLKNDVKEIPYKFGEVKGNFSIRARDFKSLNNCPDVVTGDFICGKQSNLKSFEGMPRIVGEDCYLSRCKNVKNLKGISEKIGGDLNVDFCANLASIEELKNTELGGSLNLNFCKSLTSLKGCPKVIKNNFFCISCDELTSLKYGPETVGGDYCCKDCHKLTTFDGIAKTIKDTLSAERCYNVKDVSDLNKVKAKRIWLAKEDDVDYSVLKVPVFFEQ